MTVFLKVNFSLEGKSSRFTASVDGQSRLLHVNFAQPQPPRPTYVPQRRLSEMRYLPRGMTVE